MIDNEAAVTPTVIAAMAAAPNDRLRDIMAALVRHLHDFAREVHLTEGEFEQGIDFLNRIGQATNDSHNEGVLFGDITGLSTLVCLLNNGDAPKMAARSCALEHRGRCCSPRSVSRTRRVLRLRAWRWMSGMPRRLGCTIFRIPARRR
jgi:hypothetical protein